MQLEKACNDKDIINEENLKFLNDVDVSKLKSYTFNIYKQLVCLTKMWFDSQPAPAQSFDIEAIYQKFINLSIEKREALINEDPGTKTNQ